MTTYVPSDEQKGVVESDASALVIAGPGRGKTATAIAATRDWARRHPHGRVLFTSFSNVAVQRLAAAAGIPLRTAGGRIDCRTFHSAAMDILRQYGRFAGLKRPAKTLDRTEERIVAAERSWDRTDEAAHLAHLGEYARETGKVAFELMIPLAAGLLTNSKTLRDIVNSRYPFVLVDEFQDTSATQWGFLKAIGEESRVVALCDPDQIIYERQHRDALQRLDEFKAWKDVEATGFGKNFRCELPGMITFAESILNGQPCATAGLGGLALVPTYRPGRRFVIAREYLGLRKQFANASVAIIAPSAKIGQRLAAELLNPEEGAAIPVSIRAHIEVDAGARDAFRLLLCAAQDYAFERSEERLQSLTVALTGFEFAWASPHRTEASWLKAIRDRLVNVRNRSPLRHFFTREDLSKDMAEFVPQFIQALGAEKLTESAVARLVEEGVPDCTALGASVEGSLFEHFRERRAAVGLDPRLATKPRTAMVSMSRAKGREFDHVILVVDPTGHSASATVDELRRLHYVAATRARKSLIVCYLRNALGSVLGPVLAPTTWS